MKPAASVSRARLRAATALRALLALVVLAGPCGLTACGGGGGGGGADADVEDPATYFSTVTDLHLEVVYEPSAEPFVGTIASGPAQGTSYWSIAEENLSALFVGRPQPVLVHVPHDLAGMTALPAQSQAGWTAQEIFDLAAAHRASRSSATDAWFFVAFLGGYYEEGGTTIPTVIGVSLLGTTVTAIFKDVVRAAGRNPSGPVPRFVEQSTIVHELGHSLGLVNAGLPMVAPHEDPQHPRHCTNPDCVMYWLNEGAGDLASFVQDYIASGQLVMFGSWCLDDAQSYRP